MAAKPVATHASMPITRAAAAASFSLVTIIVCMACLTRAVVAAETVPACAVFPRVKWRGPHSRLKQLKRRACEPARLRQNGHLASRRLDAALAQASAQHLAGFRQPAASRPFAPAQLTGCLLIGHLFEVAEHDRLAVSLGQTVNLLVDDRR